MELRKYGTVDDDVLAELVNACLRAAPDCTEQEILHFIEVKAKLITKETRNPIGLLKVAVPKCFTPESLREYRQTKPKTEPEVNAGAWGTDLSREELERELAAETDPRLRQLIEERLRELNNAHAQKAGQK